MDDWSLELEADIHKVDKIIVEFSRGMRERSLSFAFWDNLISMTAILLENIRSERESN